MHIAPGHSKPASINVKVLESVEAAAVRPAELATAREFLPTLFEELEDRNIRSVIWTEPSDPPPPALFLFIERYYDGDPGEGFACGWATSGIVSCGEGETLIGIRFHASYAAPTIEGQVRGWAETGAIQDEGDESAEAAAESIACVIERGNDCSVRKPRKRRTKSDTGS